MDRSNADPIVSCHGYTTFSYALGLSETDMVARLWEHVPAMLEWCDRFLHSDPVPGKGDIDFKRSAGGSQTCVFYPGVHLSE